MLLLTKQQVIRERMRMQRLLDPVSIHSIDSSDQLNEEQEFLELFRLLQPVSPVHNTRPGEPPKLVHRASFAGEAFAGKLREKNAVVKGRFCGGRIGYVFQEDLARYATAFRKPPKRMAPIHEEVIRLLRHSGGLSKEQLKLELNDYPAAEISKALQTLQEAFLVCEHQPDTDWDTGWFLFETEWFELSADEIRTHQAIAEVIHTFVRAMAFATAANMRSWSQLPVKSIQRGIDDLLKAGKIIAAETADLGPGFVCADDSERLQACEALPSCAFMLDKSDFLVRAHADELSNRYKGYEVLQYLLIDGEFQGAVLGHWRIGPYDIDDIVLELPSDQAELRKNEIMAAVRMVYSPERHSILRYQGRDV
ncbi:winged helix DNA-binding domain-containing protein [Paenibacillus rhizovicinus]|uniref:Winged helix DNA-binding domain-containing protein n=1 Tax=Paenibacillus rhizovicinus TaxID=2704463 RepID=A0A6C0P8D4_9BACL|nr:crosslink repair DNA glycosylase YcaQ family protein [Paenibacillus rhizovicinus]QHW34814.1 winged helix DNA-binding domain-containing protein [Paenibacillus rhizovicinus]